VYSKAKLPHRPGPKRARSRDMPSKHWRRLTKLQKLTRMKSFEVLRAMRHNHSFTTGCRSIAADPETMKKYLKNVIYKKKGRWHAKRDDNIERGIIIYTRGHIRHIVLGKFSTASVVGKYMNSVKFVLSGTEDYDLFVQTYKGISITDVDGKSYRLETRLDALKEIELRKEQIEYADYYD